MGLHSQAYPARILRGERGNHISDEYFFHVLIVITKTQGTLCTAMRNFRLFDATVLRSLSCKFEAQAWLRGESDVAALVNKILTQTVANQNLLQGT